MELLNWCGAHPGMTIVFMVFLCVFTQIIVDAFTGRRRKS